MQKLPRCRLLRNRCSCRASTALLNGELCDPGQPVSDVSNRCQPCLRTKQVSGDTENAMTRSAPGVGIWATRPHSPRPNLGAYQCVWFTGGFGTTLRVPGVSIRDLSTAPTQENRPKSTSSLISSIQKVADLVAEFWGSLARRREGPSGSGACHLVS